jgi:hypothetical protein
VNSTFWDSSPVSLSHRDPEPNRPAGCEHDSTEFLGFNGDAKFLRCQSCMYILVLQHDRLWAIPPLSKTT